MTNGGEPKFETEVTRLSVAIEHLTKSVDRLARELLTMRSDTRADFSAMRLDAKSEFAAMRADTRSDFATLKAESRADFRLLFGAIIASAIGLAELIAESAHWF